MPNESGGWDNRMNGEEGWRRSTLSDGDEDQRRGRCTRICSDTEIEISFRGWIKRRGEKSGDLKLGNLLPWLVWPEGFQEVPGN